MKKFALGFIIGAFLFSIVPIYAATLTAINVTYNNIKISVNGTILETDVEPFVFMNRTFVPARFIAEALGKDIKYNEITDTVEITDKVLPQPTVNPETNNTFDNTIINEPELLTNRTNFTTSDNGEKTFFSDGVKYITAESVYDMLYKTGIYRLSGSMTITNINTKPVIRVLTNIPFKLYLTEDDAKGACIEYNYYLENIFSLTQEGAD
jgi:hypothetical protein